MINIVIDPSKWKRSGLNFSLGPVYNKTKGFPFLSKGFFNIDCKSKLAPPFSFNIEMYSHYMNSWNYIFFGRVGIINALVLIHYFDLKAKNFKVVFLESMFLNKDPSYIF